MVQVAGADGCRGGWIVISFHIEKGAIAQWDWNLCLRFRDVLTFTEPCEIVAVDMPIGLLARPESGGRLCDREARRLLGRRRSSIFSPPIRGWLRANHYDEVRGKGVSRQAFGIYKKIREVDQFMTPRLQNRIREAHPELAFGSLNGRVPQHNKKSPEGFHERMSGMSGFGLHASESMWSKIDNIRKSYPATLVAKDDVLDAVILAWVADRIRRRQAYCVPNSPRVDGKGLKMEIWY